MFSKLTNPYINKSLRKESGVLLLEMAIYFPFLLLAFVMFIFASLLITQRVVLDRAVTQATSEAAAWLGTSMDGVGGDIFPGRTSQLNINPYAAGNLFNRFGSPNEFVPIIEERVVALAHGGIASGFAGNVDVTVNWRSYWVAGDLSVTARQEVILPIHGFGIRGWAFESTASARVFPAQALLNDIYFVVDAARWLFGFDANNLTSMVGNLISGAVDRILDAATSFFR